MSDLRVNSSVPPEPSEGGADAPAPPASPSQWPEAAAVMTGHVMEDTAAFFFCLFVCLKAISQVCRVSR